MASEANEPGSESGKRSDDRRAVPEGTAQEGGASTPLAAPGVFAGGLGERPFFGNVVGVVELRGVIQDATDLVDALERFRTSDATVAVVLRIDSPGGAVAPSQEIYDEVGRVRERKPVIASLGSVAASGGYYVASAASKILADPGTITGSIGAIMTV